MPHTPEQKGAETWVNDEDFCTLQMCHQTYSMTTHVVLRYKHNITNNVQACIELLRLCMMLQARTSVQASTIFNHSRLPTALSYRTFPTIIHYMNDFIQFI